jgi:hypothetical protein
MKQTLLALFILIVVITVIYLNCAQCQFYGDPDALRL